MPLAHFFRTLLRAEQGLSPGSPDTFPRKGGGDNSMAAKGERGPASTAKRFVSKAVHGQGYTASTPVRWDPACPSGMML